MRKYIEIQMSWLNRLTAYFCRILALTALILNCLLFTSTASAGTPWWHSPQVKWNTFTGFPLVENTNNSLWSWSIQERASGTNPVFFAQCLLWQYGQKFCIASHTNNPTFVEFDGGLPSNTVATSTAMCIWSNSYNEFFLGSSTGLWKYDEDLQRFVSIWYWGWDPTFIVSIGNAIYGSVLFWGSQSGEHLWTPSGEHTYWSSGNRTYQIWGDTVLHLYGIGLRYVRALSPSQSLMLINGSGFENGKYSTDGGVTFQSPVGLRADGNFLYINDFYPYSGNTIIIASANGAGDDLLIGDIGGTMSSLNCPLSNIGTFFYSPSTRLLIVGDERGAEFYSTILPAPDAVLPQLSINYCAVMHWSTQHASAKLQGRSSATGEWSEVKSPRTIVDGNVQMIVPVNSPYRLFRLQLQ